MTKTFVLAFALIAINAFGQSSNKTLDSLLHDTTLKVIYTNEENQPQKPAYFLNGQLVNQITLTTLNPEQIDSIHFFKKNIKVDGNRYYGEFYIKTKSGYNPKLISLTNLKEKYTNLGNKTAVFMIDGNFVNGDFDKCLVDENYLLRIIVDHVTNIKEQLDLAVIKLLTKSEENIKSVNEIHIRGKE